MDRSADIAIVGGGIVGLAHAYSALKKGYRVVLFERDDFSVGASVRNFGLLWPIGQAPGNGLDRALRSRQIWEDVCNQADIWINRSGSLHLAYHDDEMDVLNEFYSLYNEYYQSEVVTPSRAKELSPAIKQNGLRGALYSKTEGTVYSREAIRKIPQWLEEKGLILRFGNVVNAIEMPKIKTSREEWIVGQVIICNGADFQTLFPEVFAVNHFKKCKLQMMKIVPERPFTLGPSICAGLTLRHYAAFSSCSSLEKVSERYDRETPAFKKHGIHVLVAQNGQGELIVGDSHHYGSTMEPFDSEEVNSIIMEYFSSFMDIGTFSIIERWHGVYPKVDGRIDVVLKPIPGVTIVNGLGGAGMTLSFGLAEDVINRL